MKKIMDFIHEVPFQELDIKELEIRKEAKEKESRAMPGVKRLSI